VLALWLATRPYRGIIHDAQFYAVHALAALTPGAYQGDLHLSFGSPDRFTLFSPVYAGAVWLLGAAPAHLLLLLAGQLLWLAGLVILCRSVVRDPSQAMLAVALAVALPAGYGGRLGLIYGEPFLTPRLYAEAMTMMGLGLAIRRRIIWAGLTLAAAMAVHPLM